MEEIMDLTITLDVGITAVAAEAYAAGWDAAAAALGNPDAPVPPVPAGGDLDYLDGFAAAAFM